MPPLKSALPMLAAVAGAVAWLILSEPGSKFLSGWMQPWKALGPVAGRVVQLEGGMKTVRDGRVEFHHGPLPAPVSVHSGDRVEVDAKSRAILVLNSEDEFQIEPLAAAGLQLWNERDPMSPVYLTLFAGQTELRKAGAKGKAYVVRDGRLYLPGQKAADKPMALTVLRNAPLDMELSRSEDSPPAEFGSEPAASNSAEAPEGVFGADPETLSNEYIDETISARQGLLQKCWLARVRENPDKKVKMTVQFEITRRGKVRDVRVAESSLEDETLKNCVTQVFERITFRPYRGSEIALSYPIQFE